MAVSSTSDFISGMLNVSAANGVVVNEASSSVGDFRVESNADTHFLYVDSSADTLNIGGTGTGDVAVLTTSTVTFKQATDIQGTLAVTDDLSITGSGKGLRVATGAVTDMFGESTLSNGTVTVANTNIAANHKILLTRSTTSGTEGHLSYTVSVGASFTINSSSGSDASTINWLIVRAA
jgi:hypothetical protein